MRVIWYFLGVGFAVLGTLYAVSAYRFTWALRPRELAKAYVPLCFGTVIALGVVIWVK